MFNFEFYGSVDAFAALKVKVRGVAGIGKSKFDAIIA
jgi:hypothetical protein